MLLPSSSSRPSSVPIGPPDLQHKAAAYDRHPAAAEKDERHVDICLLRGMKDDNSNQSVQD
jgi:hypothetical protein